MQDGLPVGAAELEDHLDAVRDGLQPAVFPDDLVRPGFDDPLQEGGNIPEVVVKRIPVDAAPLYDLPHGDFAQGLLL